MKIYDLHWKYSLLCTYTFINVECPCLAKQKKNTPCTFGIMPQTKQEICLSIKKTFRNFMVLKILMYTISKYESLRLLLREKPTPIFSDTN